MTVLLQEPSPSTRHPRPRWSPGEGRFREALYFRLNVVPLFSPPLRERPEDIPLLVDYFSRAFAEENNFRPRTFSPEALEAMTRYPWKGNVRELDGTLSLDKKRKHDIELVVDRLAVPDGEADRSCVFFYMVCK